MPPNPSSVCGPIASTVTVDVGLLNKTTSPLFRFFCSELPESSQALGYLETRTLTLFLGRAVSATRNRGVVLALQAMSNHVLENLR